MNTLTYQNNKDDALHLIRALAAGKTVDVVLACGQPYRFEPNDLLRTNEAVLLFVGIEQVLAKIAHDLAVVQGNTQLSTELGVPSVIAPSLSELLGAVKLPLALREELYSLKELRNLVLHGGSPLFLRGTVKRIRKTYRDLLAITGQEPSQAVKVAIARAQSCLGTLGAVKKPESYTLFSDLLSVIDVEVCLRSYLASVGVNVKRRDAVDCAHKLLDDITVKSRKLTPRLLRNLRKVFILRNHLAHGTLLGLTSDQQALVRETASDMHAVIAGAQLAKAGGTMTVGEGFANGLAALTLVVLTR